MTDRLGQQLGNYQLIKLLGQGGFGEVYLGRHRYLNTRVAVKVLYTFLTEEYISTFLREAQVIAGLDHPHIVRIHDFGVENHVPFLVMDYAPGGTLRQRHPKGSIVSLAQVVSYVKQIAFALQYIHDRKIVFRDVKPENMLVDSNGNIVLGDFGIAIAAQSSRSIETQNVAGTPYYMAPEQFRGQPRLASDQYALGAVVYEWLCGRTPFTAGNVIELGYQHNYVSPPPLRSRGIAIPSEVEWVVMKALEKDPKARFPSVQAFADALEQASKPALSSPLKTIQPALSPEASVVIDDAKQLPTETASTFPSLQDGAPSYLESVLPTVAIPKTGKVTPTGTTTAILRGHIGEVYGLAWSPNGKRLASAGADKTVQVWDAATNRKSFTFRYTDEVHSVAWSPDGRRLAAGGADKTIQVWDATTNRKLFIYRTPSEVYTIAWSPDGTRIAWAGADRKVRVWNADTRSEVCSYRGHTDWVRAIAWSPDCKRLASGSNDKSVQVWDTITGDTILTYRGHTDWVRAVAWSPDGKYLVSGSNDKTVQVWNPVTGMLIYVYHSHEDSWLGGVLAVTWSPDGKLVASASEDQTVQVWDAFSGTKVVTYRGHSAPVDAVSWMPSGQSIASASYDSTVQVWKATESDDVVVTKRR